MHQLLMIADDSIGLQEVGVDAHLPDVLIFPAGTDLHDHPMVLAGQLILQVEPFCAPACTEQDFPNKTSVCFYHS